MTDTREIKTFVWHDGACFFVSTINRDSSSMLGGRFAETIIWEFDWKTNKRGAQVNMSSDMEGSIREHMRQVASIHETGAPIE